MLLSAAVAVIVSAEMNSADDVNSLGEVNILKARLDRIVSTNPSVNNYLNRRLVQGVDQPMCSYFIKRKDRYCTHRAAATGSIEPRCTEHSEQGI